MTLSETQTLGFSSTVQKTFVEESQALKTAGYDPDAMQSNLKQLHDEVVTLGTEQEDLKRQLKDKTKELNAGLKRLYNLTSGGVDALMTAVEKSSPAAKIIRRLRSRIRRSDYVESPDVQPVPMKTG
jgi:TolA-binding protein